MGDIFVIDDLRLRVSLPSGTVTTQLLLDRLAGRVHERRRLVVLASDLIVSESCGAQLPVA